MNMKKIITVVLSILVMLQLGIPAIAAREKIDSKAAFLNADFINHATRQKIKNADNSTTYILTEKKHMSNKVMASGIENNYVQNNLILVAADNSEAQNIESNLASAAAGYSQPAEGWFYGSSLYMFTTVNYSERYVTGSVWPLVKITSVTGGTSVNSGTIFVSRYLSAGQTGIGADGYGKYQALPNITISQSGTFTWYPPTSWVEVSADPTAGIMSICGATLHCTVYRSGGSNVSYDLTNNLWQW